MEMAKRGVPGVLTYGFYDGWVPNYLFWIAHHAQLVRPLLRSAELRAGRQPEPAARRRRTTSREWYRPNPPLPTIKWGPRNNTNIQESALLIALNKVAKDNELYLENYWLKNKRADREGQERADLRAG